MSLHNQGYNLGNIVGHSLFQSVGLSPIVATLTRISFSPGIGVGTCFTMSPPSCCVIAHHQFVNRSERGEASVKTYLSDDGRLGCLWNVKSCGFRHRYSLSCDFGGRLELRTENTYTAASLDPCDQLIDHWIIYKYTSPRYLAKTRGEIRLRHRY
jgi:hypothetical protein